MAFKIKPRTDRLILEVLEGKTETESGIIIPEAYRDQVTIQQGKIISLGKGCGEDLKEGMIVGFPKGAGDEFNIEKDDTRKKMIIRDPNIIVIIEQDEQ